MHASLVGKRFRRVTGRVLERYYSNLRAAAREVIEELRRAGGPKEARRLVLGRAGLGSTGKTGLPTWSLPAMLTCPGKTRLCSEACYGVKGFYMMSRAKARKMIYNLLASLLPEFPSWLAEQLKRHRIVRIHDTGDFYSVPRLVKELEAIGVDTGTLGRLLGVDVEALPPDWYVKAWLEAARRAPGTRIYTYTRSYRVPELREALSRLASLENVTVYASVDETTPRSDIQHAVRVSRGLIAFTGCRPADVGLPGVRAVTCPHEAARNRGAASPPTCRSCMICVHGRSPVVFPLH